MLLGLGLKSPVPQSELFNVGWAPITILTISHIFCFFHKAWCPKCNAFKPSRQRKSVLRLPPILALNCAMPRVRHITTPQKSKSTSRNSRLRMWTCTPPLTGLAGCAFEVTTTKPASTYKHICLPLVAPSRLSASGVLATHIPADITPSRLPASGVIHAF